MRLTYIKNGETLTLNREACNSCGRCIEVCPHGVLVLLETKAQIIDREACMECGACANSCETGAIRVRAGAGCASAVIQGMIRGTAPNRERHPPASASQKTDCSGAPPGVIPKDK